MSSRSRKARPNTTNPAIGCNSKMRFKSRQTRKTKKRAILNSKIKSRRRRKSERIHRLLTATTILLSSPKFFMATKMPHTSVSSLHSSFMLLPPIETRMTY